MKNKDKNKDNVSVKTENSRKRAKLANDLAKDTLKRLEEFQITGYYPLP